MNPLSNAIYHWHYTSTGDCNLSPLIFLHGWMGSCDDYFEVIELLRSTFYCIAIDLPGHGKTEVVGEDLGYEFIATARGIIQLLDSLKIERTSIVGYSFGGRLALYLALEFPDRFDLVVLESTSPGLEHESQRQARMASDASIIQKLDSAHFADFVINWYRQEIFLEIDRHPDFPTLIDRRISNNPNHLAKSLKHAGLARQPYLGDRLKVHNRPILFLVGALDLKFVSIANSLDQDCACVDLKIVPNCSHNIHFRSPQLWASLLSQHYDRISSQP